MLKILSSIVLLFCCQIAVSQNVGIGTNTPTNKLEINSTQKGNSGLKFTQLANAGLVNNYFTNEITDSLLSITDFIFDDVDNMLVCDRTNKCINAINTNGVVSKKFNYTFNNLISMCKDPLNNIYVLDQYIVYKIAAGTNALSTYATLTNGGIYDCLAFSNNALYISKGYTEIQKISSNGTVSTFSTITGSIFIDILSDNAGNLIVANNGGTIQKINTVIGGSSLYFTSTNFYDCRSIAIGLNNELYYSTTNKLYVISNVGVESEYFTTNLTFNYLGCNSNGELYGKPFGNELISKVQTVGNTYLSIDKLGNVVQVKNPDKISNNQMQINIPINTKNIYTDLLSGSYITGSTIAANTFTVGGVLGHNGTRLNGLYTDIASIGASNNVQKKALAIVLPYSIPNASYTVQVTILQEGNFQDVFTASVTNILPEGFTVSVYRVDGNGWGQNLRVAYTVFER
jgi:hypothetical protein